MDSEEKNTYFDIVIPLGPSDLSIIHKQIEFTKNNVVGYRNIYIITYNDDIYIDGCIMVSEKQFPFSMDTIAEYHGRTYRNGWYLQQLLKLYAGIVIPDITDKYLVIDADTCFLRPTTFLNENGLCLYNYSNEYHHPYFVHMEKLYPSLHKVFSDKSGICHHMMFETVLVKELMCKIEEYHGGDSFYKVFLRCVDTSEQSGASEYELYFNYLLLEHPEKIIIRPLHFLNTGNFDVLNEDNNYDYISVHFYFQMR